MLALVPALRLVAFSWQKICGGGAVLLTTRCHLHVSAAVYVTKESYALEELGVYLLNVVFRQGVLDMVGDGNQTKTRGSSRP